MRRLQGDYQGDQHEAPLCRASPVCSELKSHSSAAFRHSEYKTRLEEAQEKKNGDQAVRFTEGRKDGKTKEIYLEMEKNVIDKKMADENNRKEEVDEGAQEKKSSAKRQEGGHAGHKTPEERTESLVVKV